MPTETVLDAPLDAVDICLAAVFGAARHLLAKGPQPGEEALREYMHTFTRLTPDMQVRVATRAVLMLAADDGPEGDPRDAVQESLHRRSS